MDGMHLIRTLVCGMQKSPLRGKVVRAAKGFGLCFSGLC